MTTALGLAFSLTGVGLPGPAGRVLVPGAILRRPWISSLRSQLVTVSCYWIELPGTSGAYRYLGSACLLPSVSSSPAEARSAADGWPGSVRQRVPRPERGSPQSDTRGTGLAAVSNLHLDHLGSVAEVTSASGAVESA